MYNCALNCTHSAYLSDIMQWTALVSVAIRYGNCESFQHSYTLGSTSESTKYMICWALCQKPLVQLCTEFQDWTYQVQLCTELCMWTQYIQLCAEFYVPLGTIMYWALCVNSLGTIVHWALYSKIAGSSLEPAGSKPGRVKPKTLKLILVTS